LTHGRVRANNVAVTVGDHQSDVVLGSAAAALLSAAGGWTAIATAGIVLSLLTLTVCRRRGSLLTQPICRGPQRRQRRLPDCPGGDAGSGDPPQPTRHRSSSRLPVRRSAISRSPGSSHRTSTCERTRASPTEPSFASPCSTKPNSRPTEVPNARCGTMVRTGLHKVRGVVGLRPLRPWSFRAVGRAIPWRPEEGY